MGRNRVKNLDYNKNRRKRNLYLFLLVFPTVLVFASLIFFYSTEYISDDLLFLIYLPAIIGIVILYSFMKSRISLYSMYVDYSLMIHEDLKPVKVHNKLYTANWIVNIRELGYKILQDYPTHMLLYKYQKKLEGLSKSDRTMVIVIIAKNVDFDFYDSNVDRDIEALYVNNQEYQNVKRQVTLQFKSFKRMGDKVTKEIETMILYNFGRQTLVNLTTVYLEDMVSVYGPMPKNKYPNRYVYYACNEIKKICNVKE